MSRELVGIGLAADDQNVAGAARILDNRHVAYQLARGGAVEVTLSEELQPEQDKAFSEETGKLEPHAIPAQPGGGALNTSVELRRWRPDLDVSYLDEGSGFAGLSHALARHGMNGHALQLYGNPRNFVAPDVSRTRKFVVKQPIEERGRGAEPLRDAGRKLSEADGAVLNSLRSRKLAATAGEAARRGMPLYVVLTRSLRPDDALRLLTPYASAVIAGAPDMNYLVGQEALSSMAAAVAATDRLAACSGGGPAFVTLGEQGVLVADNETRDIVHVHCRPELLAAVGRVVASSPARVNGCGDAFAAGVVAELVPGGVDGISGHTVAVRAGIRGCMVAIRRLGWSDTMPASAFLCDSVGRVSRQGWRSLGAA